MIRGFEVSILFDSRAIDSFISPFLVECCRLVAAKQDVDWKVELASGARVSVDSLIHEFPIQIGDMTTFFDLCITPLGSYDVVLSMDWLSANNAKVDCR